jgi:hypothetical protein
MKFRISLESFIPDREKHSLQLAEIGHMCIEIYFEIIFLNLTSIFLDSEQNAGKARKKLFPKIRLA